MRTPLARPLTYEEFSRMPDDGKDDAKQILEAYRLAPGASEYHLAATFRPGDRATTPLIPDLALDLAALLAE